MCWEVLLLGKMIVADLHLLQKITSGGENSKDEKDKSCSSFSPSLVFGRLHLKWHGKIYFSPVTKVKVYHLRLKTKEKVLNVLDASYFFGLFYCFCLPFRNFPYSLWSWWRVQSLTHYFLREGWAFDTHRQWQADNLPFQTRKSWFAAFAYRVSPTLLPWLTSYTKMASLNVALGREAWNWLCWVDTSSLHQVIANGPSLYCISLWTQIGPESSM